MRYDLNMPKSLPKRRGGPRDYERDSPLTTQGHFQANLLGISQCWDVFERAVITLLPVSVRLLHMLSQSIVLRIVVYHIFCLLRLHVSCSTGSSLKDVDVPFSHVYASPSLRCIQTATDILKGAYHIG